MKNKNILSLIMIVYLIASIVGMNIKISDANKITETNELYSAKHQESTYTSKNEITSPTIKNLVDIEPIIVIGNYDFDDTIWSGDGSQDHPWTLGGYRVSGYTVGVFIKDVDVHFLIKNCHFVNNRFGAYFVDTTNGVIENNNISHNIEEGVVLMSWDSNSEENTIENNYINYNRIGIQLGLGFPFQPSEEYPNIWLYYVGPSNLNVIINNEIHNNTLSGIDISYSIFNEVGYNTMSDHIYISRESERNSIYNNSIQGGIILTNSKSNTIRSNNLDPGIIQLSNSEKNIIYSNTIKNSMSPGMYLSDSHKNEIYWNTICGHYGDSWDPTGSGNGIKLSNSHTNLIRDNYIYENRYAGIYFYLDSENCSIEGNTIYSNQIGILFNDTATGNCIINNDIYENTLSGILISKAFLFSSNQYICGNSIHENNIGIKLFYASDNIIEYNRVFSNTLGLVLNDSSSNIIISNVIQNNTQYGVSSGSSAQNNITGNNFLCNYMLCEYPNSGFRQAYDDGDLNDWNANFWDDMTSNGPYTIDGPSGTEDTSPAENPYDLSEFTCGCPYDIMTSKTHLNFGILEIILSFILIIFINTKIVRKSKNGLLNKKNRRLDKQN